MSLFLGHLPIELKLNSNQTEIQITPKYFPYDDVFFGKIYYTADQLYLCLEIEDVRHKFVRIRKVLGNGHKIRKKLHTKFWSRRYWEIDNSSLGQTFTYSISDLKRYIKKAQGFKFKIRATYRYDRTINMLEHHKKVYNHARTYVFSNELTLEI